MHIEFVKNHGAYSPGDIAGFDPSVAEVLLEKGVAIQKQWEKAADIATKDAESTQADSPARGRRKQ